MFATRENATEIRSRAAHADPDGFSLDIDGIEDYIADALPGEGSAPEDLCPLSTTQYMVQSAV